jgi:hypothetical protein
VASSAGKCTARRWPSSESVSVSYDRLQAARLRVVDELGPESGGQGRNGELVAERRPHRRGQLLGQGDYIRVVRRGLVAQMGDLLIGQPVPSRIHRACPGIGEQIPHHVGRVAVEQAERAGIPLIALDAGHDVTDPVEQDGRCGLQAVEKGLEGGTHRAYRRRGDRLTHHLGIAVILGQPVQQETVRVRQAQGVAEGAENLGRGLRSRPCSSRMRYSTLMPARVASSARRSPGVRRRRPVGRSTSAGVTASRRARRKVPNSLSSTCRTVQRVPSRRVSLSLPPFARPPRPASGLAR